MKNVLISALTLLAFSSAFAAEQSMDNPENQGSPAFERGDVVCQAHNARGEVFEGVAFRVDIARDRAIENCRRYGSAVCYLDGCRYRY